MSINNLGGSEVASVSELLKQPAESFGNDPAMEMHWAMKAFHHAETYFRLITAVDPTMLKLTQMDNEIYSMFRAEFPELDVTVVKEDDMKSPAGKEKWRELLNKFDGKVEDWNMGTLLRLDAAGDITEANTTLVPRIQFLAIEIARNREGINKATLHKPKTQAAPSQPTAASS